MDEGGADRCWLLAANWAAIRLLMTWTQVPYRRWASGWYGMATLGIDMFRRLSRSKDSSQSVESNEMDFIRRFKRGPRGLGLWGAKQKGQSTATQDSQIPSHSSSSMARGHIYCLRAI